MEKLLRLGGKRSFNIYVYMSHHWNGMRFPSSHVFGKWYNNNLHESKIGTIFTYPTPSPYIHTTNNNLRAQLLTTRTWRYLGLHPFFGYWMQQNYGEGIVIGVIDTGITPQHPSFYPTKVPSPPHKWKGTNFYSNKVIGLRNYGPCDTPIDDRGHGTHMSSIAGGNFYFGAHVLGQAKGMAAGMAPLCHLASYKICKGALPSEFFNAISDAVKDGVDLINISMGFEKDLPLYFDPIAMGALKATQEGILVCCAAGNFGPKNVTAKNCAPWILTVGASHIDRNLSAIVHLGDNRYFHGQAIFQPSNFPAKFFPVVRAHIKSDNADFRGKIVFWEISSKLDRLQVEGAKAVIFMNETEDGYDTTPKEALNFPTSLVSYADGMEIRRYIESTQYPVASIEYRGTIVGIDKHPDVAPFSSRGPSKIASGIVKPDVVAPGCGILGAYAFAKNDAHQFSMDSGTSQACAHTSGIVALIKKAHPNWSPAAIKSAIMTTSEMIKEDGELFKDEPRCYAKITAIGAGHVNPIKASDPGMIFDIHHDDYIPYLFGLGYKENQVSRIIGKEVKMCMGIEGAELNFPCFMFHLEVGGNKTFSRTVTNVGEPTSTYVMIFDSIPSNINVEVVPEKLQFESSNQKLTYTMRFRREREDKLKTNEVVGSMTWTSCNHSVRTQFHIILSEEPNFNLVIRSYEDVVAGNVFD